MCYVFQSFGCNSQASWAEWIFIFTSQPARHLACKVHPKKVRKTHQNLSLHKNHHPGKRPKLSTFLSSIYQDILISYQHQWGAPNSNVSAPLFSSKNKHTVPVIFLPCAALESQILKGWFLRLPVVFSLTSLYKYLMVMVNDRKFEGYLQIEAN